jgi:hypothetical protein
MNAILNSGSVREKTAFLGIAISLMFWANPVALVLAHSDQNPVQNQPLVFEVKNPISNLQSETASEGLKIDEIVENDPLINNLALYLKKHNSPLAEYAKDIILEPQWQRALAISWVESNFGRFCHSNNCSGIGGAPGMKSWRKYTTKLDWFKDMCKLLERPIYKERYTTFQKMNGVYVQPGSANWINGATKKFSELNKLTKESEEQRQLIAQKHAEKLALETFPSVE